MKSKKSEDLKVIVDAISNRNWENASYAHLTAILHGYNNYDYFWNIDADDTRFCVSINKMYEILDVAELYAKKYEIDCFSLDMWNSETRGKHWSFGVTFMNSKNDYIQICTDRRKDEDYFSMDKEGNSNIDWFFTYLRNKNILNIKSFYVDNLKFIHYSNDFFEKPVGSGLYHWQAGKLIYPLMNYGFGIEEEGVFDICSGTISLNVNVTDKDTSATMAYYTREGKDLGKYYDIETMVNDEICHKKFDKFIQKHGFKPEQNPEIICFGAGNALEKNIKKINKICKLRYVCDNDETKWGKIFAEGVKCICPDELKYMENIIVIILIYSSAIVNKVAEQLSEIGVDYDVMDCFLQCVE